MTRRILVCCLVTGAMTDACSDAPPPATESTPKDTPPAEFTPAEEPPEAEEAELDPAQFDFQSDTDRGALYAAPVIERARAVRRGRRARLRLQWSPVVDALEYEVQVARNLTFGSTRENKRVKKRSTVTRPLPLGLYFVRVRAIGELGHGPWSAAKAIAPRGGAEVGSDALEPTEIETETESEPSRRPDPARRPLTLRLVDFPDRTLSPAPSLILRGRAVRGANVSAGGASVVADPGFELTVKLEHGRNDVRVVASLDGERVERSGVVYYADPRRVQKDLTQLRTLRQQLQDLRSIQREVRAASRALTGALEGAPAEEATALQAELDEIEAAAGELDREIEAAFAAVQRLLQ